MRLEGVVNCWIVELVWGSRQADVQNTFEKEFMVANALRFLHLVDVFFFLNSIWKVSSWFKDTRRQKQWLFVI